MYCIHNSSPTLTNCTIAENSAGRGTGLFGLEGSSLTVTNCIIWGNGGEAIAAEPDEAFISVRCSCVEGSWEGEGNTDADPLFVQRGAWEECDPASGPDCIPYEWDNDGSPTSWRRWTFDYHLQPGSPCIDTGSSEGAPTTDIEGSGRPCGAGVDMGAYEFGDCDPPTEFKRGDPNADSKQNITDAVFILRYLFTGGDTPGCLKAADSDDTGNVDLTDAIYLLMYLFLGESEPPPPFPTCGPDPTIDELGCDAFVGCQE